MPRVSRASAAKQVPSSGVAHPACGPAANPCIWHGRQRGVCVALRLRGELQPEADDEEPEERGLKLTIVWMLLLSYSDLLSDLALAWVNIRPDVRTSPRGVYLIRYKYIEHSPLV